MNYYFNVSDQILTCTNTRRTIISDSVNVHIAKFKFDSMWDGFGKTATFTNSKTGISVNKVIDLDQCVIPYEVLVATQEGGNLVVCVTGVKDDVTFPTKMDMNYPLVIGLSSPHSGVPAQPPTQNVYDQIMTILGSYGTIAIEDALVGSISDLTTEFDDKIPNVGQIKEYINNRLA
jgi:hypothetical protein